VPFDDNADYSRLKVKRLRKTFVTEQQLHAPVSDVFPPAWTASTMVIRTDPPHARPAATTLLPPLTSVLTPSVPEDRCDGSTAAARTELGVNKTRPTFGVCALCDVNLRAL
jgi:hypothetical protein